MATPSQWHHAGAQSVPYCWDRSPNDQVSSAHATLVPEPIDLELDLKNRVLYWTDRGDPPRGNTVNRAPIDVKPTAGVLPEIV